MGEQPRKLDYDELIDSSDEEQHSPLGEEDLPAEVWRQPAASHVPQLVRCATRLVLQSNKLMRENTSLRSSLEELPNKRADFDAQYHSQLQDQEKCQQVLRARLETLEVEQLDLQARAEQQEDEFSDLVERDRDASAHKVETELRINRLMDQMVKLLSANPSPETARHQIAQVVRELEASDERLSRQLQSLQERFEAARMENRRAANQLSDEQQRTKQLHDALCQLQAEFFGSKPRSGRFRAGSRRLESVSPKQVLVDELPALAPNGMPVEGVAVAPAYASLAQADLALEPAVGAACGSLMRSTLRSVAMISAPLVSPPVQPHRSCTKADDGSTACIVQCPAVESRCENVSDAALVDSSEAAPTTYQCDRAPAQLEERLRDVLEEAQFESLVIRLGDGWYQFGEQVRANVKMNDDGHVYASVDQICYEPLGLFIGKISASKQSSTPVSNVRDSIMACARGADAMDGVDDELMVRVAAVETKCGNMVDLTPCCLSPSPSKAAGKTEACCQSTSSDDADSQDCLKVAIANRKADDALSRRSRGNLGIASRRAACSLAAHHNQDCNGAMPTPPGPHHASRRAWSPASPAAITMSVTTHACSPIPRACHAGDDAAGRCAVLADVRRVDLPCSPRGCSRLGSGIATSASGFSGTLPVAVIAPPATATTIAQAASPPRRACSPHEAASGARTSLGRSTSRGGGGNPDASAAGTTPGIGQASLATHTSSGCNYGSGTYSVGSPRLGQVAKPACGVPRDLTPTPISATRAGTPTEHVASRSGTPRGGPAWRSPQQVLSGQLPQVNPHAPACGVAAPHTGTGVPSSRPATTMQANVAAVATSSVAFGAPQPLRACSPLPAPVVSVWATPGLSFANPVALPHGGRGAWGAG